MTGGQRQRSMTQSRLYYKALITEHLSEIFLDFAERQSHTCRMLSVVSQKHNYPQHPVGIAHDTHCSLTCLSTQPISYAQKL